jgi:hypothetical protein
MAQSQVSRERKSHRSEGIKEGAFTFFNDHYSN